jgi:DNA end-binding protein Ku
MPVAREQISRGYEYGRDQYVVIDDDEIRRITPKTSREMEIVEFVKFQEVDPVYLETSYYVTPDTGGEKAYAMLFEALRQTGYAAVARIAMHSREHVAILRTGRRGLVMHTMFYADEVREDQEYRTDASLVSKKELDLATMFVQALTAPFEPGKFKDTFRENLNAMIESKVRGREVVPAQTGRESAPVIDIMEALRKSLAQVRKPVTKAAPVPATKRRRAT